MKQFKLQGVNMLGEVVKLSADVAHFQDPEGNFEISLDTPGTIKLVTTKGSYILKRHTSLNVFMGECNGHKVLVTLKKVVGLLTYW